MSSPAPAPALSDLARLFGMTAAQVGALHLDLGVTSVSDLELLARTRRLRRHAAFGAEEEERLVSLLARGHGWRGPRLLDALRFAASRTVSGLARSPAALRLSVTGAVRRMAPVASGVEILATAHDPDALRQEYEALRVPEGQPRVELEIAPDDARFFARLALRTGGEEFAAALRRRAQDRGLVLGEDGLLDGGVPVPLGSEEELFARLDIPWRPPEDRDGSDPEAPVASDLVSASDVLGVLHVHTSLGFGRHSAEEMADRAGRDGYDWIALTDSGVVAAPGDDDVEGRAEVVRGVEVGVLPDGTLEASEETLASAEVVVAVVDARDGEDVTARMVRAAAHPKVHVLGRPEGRVLLGRPGPRVDIPRVLDACATHRTAVEIDGDPHRLDLDPRWHGEARRRGLRAVLGADAHDLAGIEQGLLAVGAARRGGWRRDEVLNTMSAAALREWCRARPVRGGRS